MADFSNSFYQRFCLCFIFVLYQHALAAVNEDLARPFDKQAELDEAIKRWEEVKSQIAEGREKFSSKQAESEEESASEQNETPAEESELKEQPETQSEPEFAKLAESTNDAESAEDMTSSTKETLEFETGEFTHSKTGEKIPQAKLKDRVEREEYLRLNSLAKKHGGYYSKFSKSFLFKSAEERDAFVSEAVQNNNIGESESLTDAQINEAAKNPDTANALEQLGAKIENGKIITPDEETNDWLKRHVIIARAFDESKSSLRGSGDTTIRDYVALKDLTEQQKIYQRLGKDMGVRVVFFSNKNSDFHGAHAGNISYINVNGEMPINQVFWHESSHWLKSTNPELWEKLRKTAGITDAQRKAYLEDTERTDLTTNEAIDEEIISDYFEDAMKREGFFTEIGRKDPSLIQRVIAWLQDAMGKFFEYFNNPKGKLTNAQKQRMAHELGRVASKLVNQNGQKIFRYNNRTHAIELATGGKLENLDISNHTIDGIKKAVKGSKPEFEKLQKTNPINVSNHIPKQANNSNLKRATVDAFIDRYPQGVTVETKIGEVKISRSNIKESLGHTLYPSKADAVLSLPEGMRKAAYIGKLHDFYNKPIENHYFVYPIIYENKNRLVFCRIREITGRGHSFYVHDVFITDEIKVKSNALSQTQTPANRQGELRGVALYETILTEFFAEGNRKEPLEAGKYNAAEQFGGRVENGRLIFDNAKDADAYTEHVRNMERGEFKYSFAGEKAKTAPLENKKADFDDAFTTEGRLKNPWKARQAIKEALAHLRGVPIVNKATGIVAQFGKEGVTKLVSDKAMKKSVANGFTERHHFEAASNIKQLFEEAQLSEIRPDRDGNTNIKSIKYFDCETNILGDDAVASIMVKDTVQHGHHIYTIKLQKLNKPTELKNQAVNDSSVGSESSTLKIRQDSTTDAEEPSDENIPQTKFAGNGDLERMFAEAKPVTNAQLNGQQRKWIELGKSLGVQVQWIDVHTDLKGALKDSVIYLNRRANDSIEKTFWHEQFHLTAALQPELYRDLLKYFSGKDAFSKEQLDAYREENNRTDLTDAEVIEEILSDNFGQVQKRVQLLRELGRDNSSLAERFVAWLKYLADKVVATFRNPEGGMTTAQRDAFIKGISDLAESMQVTDATTHEGTKFSANPSTTEKLKAKIDNFLWNVKNERPRNHMRKLLEKLSGYQIRTGHVAEGIDILVKDISKVIRTPNAYEWKKLLPEVGKLVAKRLNLNPTTEQGNYIASWLMDGAPNDTSQAAKDFQRAMRETDDMYRDQLLEVQSIFSEWANRPPEQIAKDVIEHGNETKPLIDRGKGKLAEGYQQFVEELYPVKQLVDQYEKDNAKKLAAGENPYNFLRLLRGMAGRGKRMIEGDEITVGVLKRLFPSVNFNNFKTLNTILKSCDALDNEENQREFSTYLLACAVKDLHKLNAANLRQQAELRDKIDTLEDELDTLTDKKKIKDTEKRIEKLQEELKALKKKIYATPFDEYETTYDNKVCDGTIAKYKDKYGQAQKDIISYQRTLLDMMVDSGILSEEQKIGYMKTYPNHIPMFRKFDENEDKNFGDSLKAMTGSTRDIIDPLASLTKNTYDFVRRAEKNKAKCLLANLARTGALGTVVEVDERTPLDEVDNKKPDVNTTITFFEGGQKKYLDTDPAVVKAVNNLSIPQMSWITKFMRVGTILLRNFATVFNPPFAFRNLIMDNQNAMLYSKYGFFSPADFVRGFLSVWNRDADYNEWMAMGGAQASFWSVDRDYTQASLDRLRKGRWGQYKSKPWQLLSLLGEWSELGTRVGYYKKVKKALAEKNGGKIDTNILIEAALESRDLTDFARGGKASRTWNNAVAFANASIQGWDKFFRTYDPRQYWSKDPEVKKQWEYAMIRLALGSILPTVFCFLVNTSGDDDWYEKDLPDWERQTHWCLGEYLRVPKGQDVGLRFFSNLTESMLRYMAKNDPKAFENWFDPVKKSLPDWCPTALQPIFECLANYDMFKKLPIVPQRQQRLSEHMQFDSRTSETAKWLGDSSLVKFLISETGVSPAKVDHFLYGYTGKLGQTALGALEIGVSKVFRTGVHKRLSKV